MSCPLLLLLRGYSLPRLAFLRSGHLNAASLRCWGVVFDDVHRLAGVGLTLVTNGGPWPAFAMHGHAVFNLVLSLTLRAYISYFGTDYHVRS